MINVDFQRLYVDTLQCNVSTRTTYITNSFSKIKEIIINFKKNITFALGYNLLHKLLPAINNI
jgi:hypothetical protein